jgi:hypothetical protein
MVSNALELDLEELYATLERLRVESADDAQYVDLRSALPSDWPL